MSMLETPNRARLRTALVALAAAGIAAVSAAAEWGSYARPFSAQSPWNARPIDPVLGDFVIPPSTYMPAIAGGAYSTGAFRANKTDKPMEILPLPGRNGVWDPDAARVHPSITIPRWPADVIPATGSDGHADIVDETDGIIHSFFKLKQIDGQWRTAQYAWTRLDGRGWGEPGHYYQGARAAAVPTMGGLIRSHEINDGNPMYLHALAMSLAHNGLSADPTYVFPATSADRGAARTNTGQIPEGALLMLPAEYDTSRIRNPRLRKVAETLKVYGAYVVDRNVGTPFVIYVENGSGFSLHGGSWDSHTGNELNRMRAALRQVTGVSGWLDGDGRPMVMEQRLNLLSMRGDWTKVHGDRLGTFETWQQAVVFEAGLSGVEQKNSSASMLQPVRWALPQAGASYQLTARTTGGGRLRMRLFGADPAQPVFDSGELANGESRVFTWPAGPARHEVTAFSGDGSRMSTVGASLVQLTQGAQSGGQK
ncbi:MAG: Atrophin-1 multi-domain protein [Pseudorhodoferax sp.]